MSKTILLALFLSCAACEIQATGEYVAPVDAGQDAAPASVKADVEGCIRLDDPRACVGGEAWTCIGSLPRVAEPVVPCEVSARQPWADAGVTVMCCGAHALIGAPSAARTPAKI